MDDNMTIQRRANGTIDIHFYLQHGNNLRSEAAYSTIEVMSHLLRRLIDWHQQKKPSITLATNSVGPCLVSNSGS